MWSSPCPFSASSTASAARGNSVMVHERPGMFAGPVWARTSIGCHNTNAYVDLCSMTSVPALVRHFHMTTAPPVLGAPGSRTPTSRPRRTFPAARAPAQPRAWLARQSGRGPGRRAMSIRGPASPRKRTAAGVGQWRLGFGVAHQARRPPLQRGSRRPFR